MENEPANLPTKTVALAIIKLIEEMDPPRGLVLDGIDYCRSHIENRTAIETALLVAGCSSSNFTWDADLELYYDIKKADQEVGFISRGWDDPGYRLGEVLAVNRDKLDELDKVKKYCETNGVVMSIQENMDSSNYAVVLEYVIYKTGFDGQTFAQALSTLIECSNRVKSC